MLFVFRARIRGLLGFSQLLKLAGCMLIRGFSAGVGLYPIGALINHACQPNAVQVFDGATILFRAVKSISPGPHRVPSQNVVGVGRQGAQSGLHRS